MLRQLKELLFVRERRRHCSTSLASNENAHAALANQATLLKEQGDRHFANEELAEAEHCYRKALAINPRLEEVYNNLGVVLDKLGRFGEAIESFLQALSLEPNYPVACLNIGNWHRAHGNLDEQIHYFEKAIAARPDYFEAYNNLGSSFHTAGKNDEAIACFEKALSIKPDFAQAFLNLSICHRAMGNLHEEIACLEKALSLQPDFHEAHNQLGFTWQTQCEFKKAEQCHRTALAINPDSATNQLNLSHALLQQGDYLDGLKFFEARFAAYKIQTPDYDDTYFSTATKAPPWTGEDLYGKTLLLWMEQGLGDNLMMLRHLPELLRKGAQRLVLSCRPELARIVRQLPYAPDVVLSDTEIRGGPYDYHCALTSLPYLLDIRLETIPNSVPYLFVPNEMKRKWADRLEDRSGIKIGLVWAGNSKMPRDALRSMPLEILAPIRHVPGVVFVSLQKGAMKSLESPTDWLELDWIDECEDFLDTAALVENLDLVIGVDTSTVHLAGALGKPVWLMNRFESEWRWMTGRSDSPWYPTLRIFRQPALHDWQSVVSEITTELGTWVTAKKGSQSPVLDVTPCPRGQ